MFKLTMRSYFVHKMIRMWQRFDQKFESKVFSRVRRSSALVVDNKDGYTKIWCTRKFFDGGLETQIMQSMSTDYIIKVCRYMYRYHRNLDSEAILKRMHSSRIRSARSLAVSHSICWGHACHACPLPHMPPCHACPPPHMPSLPCTPHCYACPSATHTLLPCMPPATPPTMHAPLPCMFPCHAHPSPCGQNS